MPDTVQTLADLIADRFDVSDEVASDLLQDAPLVRALELEEASDGTTHKYAKKVGEPTVGFRAVNTGRFTDKSDKVLVTADLALLDWTFYIDQAVAKANRKKSELAHVEEEGMESLAAAIAKFEYQLWNGQVHGDAAGFEGFLDAATLQYNDSDMVVDAGGDTANATTSVYALRLGRGAVKGVYKGDGDPFEVGETTQQKIDDGENGSYAAWYTPGMAWLGMQLGSKFSVGRICNLDFDHTLDDDLISQLLDLFPVGHKPTHLAMNRASRGQLQRSRTATNPTGAPAPFPESAFGHPILTTDQITNTEPVTVVTP